MNKVRILRICVAVLGWDNVYSRIQTHILKNKNTTTIVKNCETLENTSQSPSIIKCDKLSRNKVSGLHAFGCVLLITYYKYISSEHKSTENNILSIIEPFSVGYFLYDSIHLINSLIKKINITSLGYLIHHIIVAGSILYYKNQSNKKIFLILLGLGEFSNIPSYIMYQLIHTYKKRTSLTNWIHFYQTVHYSFIRVILLPYYYMIHKKKNFVEVYFFVIWLMGVYWSRLLWGQLLGLHPRKIPSLRLLQQHPHTF